MLTEEQKRKKQLSLLGGVAEILGGWFGFLGIGWLIVGLAESNRQQVTNGILYMFLWWVVIGMLGGFSVITAGLGAACLGPIWLIVPLVSGNSVMKTYKEM